MRAWRPWGKNETWPSEAEGFRRVKRKEGLCASRLLLFIQTLTCAALTLPHSTGAHAVSLLDSFKWKLHKVRIVQEQRI